MLQETLQYIYVKDGGVNLTGLGLLVACWLKVASSIVLKWTLTSFLGFGFGGGTSLWNTSWSLEAILYLAEVDKGAWTGGGSGCWTSTGWLSTTTCGAFPGALLGLLGWEWCTMVVWYLYEVPFHFCLNCSLFLIARCCCLFKNLIVSSFCLSKSFRDCFIILFSLLIFIWTSHGTVMTVPALDIITAILYVYTRGVKVCWTRWSEVKSQDSI